MDLRKYIPPDQALFPALLDQITDVCLAVDAQGRIRFANRACEQLMGRPLNEFAGTLFETLVHVDDWPEISALMADLRSRPDHTIQQTFRYVYGEVFRILEATWASIPRLNGEPLLMVSGNDATERVQAQIALKEREAELRRAERGGQLATWERNLTTNRFTASRQLFEIYGLSRDSDIDFKDLARYVPPEDLAFVRRTMQKAHETLGSVAFDHRITRPDGEERIVHLRGDTKLSGTDFIMIGTLQDVTDMRAMERALRVSEQRFRAIFDSTFQFIGLLQTDGILIEANETALRFGGLHRNEVIGKPFWECYWWSVGAEQQERLKGAIRTAAGGEFVRYNTEVFGADERLTIIDFSIKPLFGADGSVEMLIPEGRDITDEVTAQQALESSEALYRSLITSLSDGVLLVDSRGSIVAVNPSAERLLGQPANSLIGRNVSVDWNAVHADGSPMLPEEHPALMSLGSRTSLRNQVIGLRITNTGIRWISINAEPIEQMGDARDRAAVLSMSDMTDRILHETQIQDSNRRLRELAAQLHNVQEEERARIAREVHDVLGQAITSLRLDIVWLLDQFTNPEPAFRKRADSILSLVEQTINTVRRISHELRPGVLDHFGLPAAIEWLCEQQKKRTDIVCTTVDETSGRIEELDPKLAIALFRIFQEALTNIMKHSGASSMRTHLAVEHDTLTMEIADDGRGIRPEDIEQSTSLGLLNMRERIFPWNGSVAIDGKPNQGTRITVRVRLPQSSRRSQ
ncbi:MAG: PAS domain S-box protein [Rhodothermales bacterium]|nr:PAS domain S-box protein [Rhodothermales bacterium]